MAFFISFEGGEGSGKSTQVQRLSHQLAERGYEVDSIHEPGSTPLGDYLGSWLKDEKKSRGETISLSAELFLFVAARAELVARVIAPIHTGANSILIADRYADSTTAYQGYGRRMSLADVAVINKIATSGIMPDLTILLDTPPAVGLERVGSTQVRLPLEMLEDNIQGRMDVEGTKRFEEMPLKFHERVRAGYLKLAEAEPMRWCVIDAVKNEDQVAEEIWQIVSERLEAHARVRPRWNKK